MASNRSASTPTRTQPEQDDAGSTPRLVTFGVSGSIAYPVPEHGTLTIGRGEECDVRIDDPSVSRVHARLVLGDAPVIEDLESRNGVRVEGRRLEPRSPVPIFSGRPVEIGSAVVVLRLPNDRDEARRSLGVVSDTAMDRVRQIAQKLAKGRLSVLLLGETGVGKELLAAYIHGCSTRASGPLVRLNCAALPENLLEAELFGHERGSFTAKIGTTGGVLRAAHKGTLLLDEVGDMPLTTQATLLRLLEARDTIHDASEAEADVRFVASTHRDLPKMVADGEFRADLYHRIAAVELRIPPLRKRVDEILSLAQQFLTEACAEAMRPSPMLTPAAMNWLQRAPWPGNVRQLRNVIECAALLAPGEEILPEHFTALGSESTPHEEHSAPLDATIAAIERKRIEDALARCHGNQSAAAKLLGLTRRALIHRLDVHGLPRPRRDAGK